MRTILLTLCILSVTFSVNAQMFGRKWVEGRVYDLNNKRFNGFIAWTPPEPTFKSKIDDHLYFKDDKKKNEIEVRSSKIRSFVIGADSFVVSHNPQLATAPFVSVVIDKPIKLFVSYTTRSSPAGGIGMIPIGISFNRQKGVYYFGADADFVTQLDKDNFVDAMSRIMSDKPEVVAKIADKTYKYRHRGELIKLYLTGQTTDQTNNDDN
jgi:hypothetical protein